MILMTCGRSISRHSYGNDFHFRDKSSKQGDSTQLVQWGVNCLCMEDVLKNTSISNSLKLVNLISQSSLRTITSLKFLIECLSQLATFPNLDGDIQLLLTMVKCLYLEEETQKTKMNFTTTTLIPTNGPSLTVEDVPLLEGDTQLLL